MKVLKFFTNDIVLFCINIFILKIFYFNYVFNSLNILNEIFFISIFYYIISVFTSLSVMCIFYIFVKESFNDDFDFSYIKKLEIISFIFNRFYEDIDSIYDFKVKLKEQNNRF